MRLFSISIYAICYISIYPHLAVLSPSHLISDSPLSKTSSSSHPLTISYLMSDPSQNQLRNKVQPSRSDPILSHPMHHIRPFPETWYYTNSLHIQSWIFSTQVDTNSQPVILPLLPKSHVPLHTIDRTRKTPDTMLNAISIPRYDMQLKAPK